MSGRSLGQAFALAARKFGVRPALWCRGEVLSYADLLDRAGRIAAALDGLGWARPGERVAILADRTPTAYVGVLAALLAGAAYVPLNPRFPPARNRNILASSGARTLICDERNRATLGVLFEGLKQAPALILPESSQPARLGTPQLTGADLARGDAPASLPCERASGELAYVFFTSGSTGAPKGVPISHTNVFAYLEGIGTWCEFGPEDRVLQLVDLTFDLSVHDMFLSWLAGACLYSVPENAVLLSTRLIEEHEATALLAVPSMAALIKQAGLLDPGSMPSIRYSFFCGEALTGTVAEAWATAAPNSQIINIYGPTEATVAFSAYRYRPGQTEPPKIIPLGEPFSGQHMALFDALGARSAEEIGEICLAGSQVTEGYWRAPELNEARFFQAEGRRWYRTGDLGRYEPGEGFHYAGRADHQVKLRGYRVELHEIEGVVRQVTGSDLVAVLPWPVMAEGNATGCIAFVLNSREPEDTVIARCAEVLPDYMLPGRILSVTDIPFNSNGKVDYPALRLHPLLAKAGKTII